MNIAPHRYFVINKPYNMVSQFVSSHAVKLLGHLNFDFPEGTHAIGRLDNNSEGLLLLTTNKKVTRLLFGGEEKHTRVYLVQINNNLSEENLRRLREGVTIKIEGNEDYITPACPVYLANPRDYYQVDLSENFGPHSWIIISLTEGKYHQVRKMIGAIHHRCKRLIRISIENISLSDLPSGGVKEMNEEDFFRKLKIKNSE